MRNMLHMFAESGERFSLQTSAIDTLVDAINYCTLLIAALDSDEIYFLSACNANMFEREEWSNVDI